MKLTSQDIGNLDKSINDLFECHPLPEAEVKFICEKVFLILNCNIYRSKGKRNSEGRKQCNSCKVASDSLWRCAWVVS